MNTPDAPPAANWQAVAQLAIALGEETELGPLLERAIDLIRPATRAVAIAIYLAAESEARLAVQRGFPADLGREADVLSLEGPGIVGRAAITGKLQLVERLADVSLERSPVANLARRADFRSLLVAPLQVQGRPLGLLVLAGRAASPSLAAEAATVEAVASIVASSILSAQNVAEDRRIRAALEAVNVAALAISAELSPARVLQELVERARQVANAHFAALGIGTDPTRSFEPWVFSGIDELTARHIGHFPRPVGMLGAVVREGVTIRQRDLSKDPRFRGWPPHHPPMTSYMGVPIRYRGESIGNLYLTNKIGAAEFSEKDEQAVEMLAAHAAITYKHAQLYEQLQIERARLESVLQNSPAGIIFVEAKTGYIYANRAAEVLFGLALVPEKGREQYQGYIVHPDGTPLELDQLPISRALRGERVLGAELLIRRHDGRDIVVLANADLVRDAEGRIIGAVVIYQDVTPLKLERVREEFVSAVAQDRKSVV